MLINWTEIIGKCCFECKFLEIGFEKEFLRIRTDVYIFFRYVVRYWSIEKLKHAIYKETYSLRYILEVIFHRVLSYKITCFYVSLIFSATQIET